MAEFRQAEALQRAVWGEGDKEDPADLMMVIQKEGGLAGGAFHEGYLMGYVFGFPTREPHVQHSHRLAVLSQARGAGLGWKLKSYQRRWCLERGITHVRWTFDPLRAANATLNMHRLGASASTYFTDFYGDMAGINKGVPSDRLLADWHLEGALAARRAEGDRALIAEPAGLTMRIAIPEDVERLLMTDPQAALEARLILRRQMQDAFAKGFVVRDFDAGARHYVLLSGEAGR
jgi:predicted GNAT superfamily acetyltransferase